jgi:predicted cobalt transporter CbtA
MFLLSIQEAQAVILGFAALIILIIIIFSVRKWGWKSLIFWLIIGFIAYLLISNVILG